MESNGALKGRLAVELLMLMRGVVQWQGSRAGWNVFPQPRC